MGVRPSAASNVPVTALSLPDGRDLAFAEYGDPLGVAIIAFHGTTGSHEQLAPADAAARDACVVARQPSGSFDISRIERAVARAASSTRHCGLSPTSRPFRHPRHGHSIETSATVRAA
jgi:hypothetical protein